MDAKTTILLLKIMKTIIIAYGPFIFSVSPVVLHI